MHEQLKDVGRATEKERRIKQALAARQPRAGVTAMTAARSSRMLVWLGNRLVAWGQRLKQPQEAMPIKY